MRNGLMVWLLAVAGVAWVVRTVLVSCLRRRAPRAAAAVDRWWLWAPFVVVVISIALLGPIFLAFAIAAVVVTWLALMRSSASGSPFRPRR